MQKKSFFKSLSLLLVAASFVFVGTGCNWFELTPPDEYETNHPNVDVLTPPPGSILHTTDPYGNPITIISQNGYSVSTSDAYATAAAADVLESGGNAVDAAIAAAYVLGVVEPYGSGIGGGGGMTIYDPKTNEYKFLNYLAEAPASGSR